MPEIAGSLITTNDGTDDLSTFYYNDGTSEVGPFPFEHMRRMAEAGIIGRKTLIRYSEGGPWSTFGAVGEGEDDIDQRVRSTPLDRVRVKAEIQDEQAEAAAEAKTLNGWLPAPATPWRRYAARSIDYFIYGFLGFAMVGVAAYSIAPASADRVFMAFETGIGPLLDMVMTALMAALIGGPIVGLTGSSPGKWIFGVKITREDRTPLGLGTGLMRDLSIFVRGVGFGIPLISLICMITAYNRLKREGETSWDEDRFTAWHRPSGPLQWSLNALGIVILLAMSVAVAMLSQL